MWRYGPDFAMLLARWIGYRAPLIARLRDRAVEKTPAELEFVADAIAGRVKWPRGNRATVVKARMKLRRTVTFMRFNIVDGLAEKTAKIDAASRHGVTKRTIEADLSFAKKLGGGEWWAAASRLARKGRTNKHKLAQLQRTY